MAQTPTSTRSRLIQSALELFSSQGFSTTTTRQIAEGAGVNEVTLFRNFGSKLDLLLAVIQGSDLFMPPGESLLKSLGADGATDAESPINHALVNYCRDRCKL